MRRVLKILLIAANIAIGLCLLASASVCLLSALEHPRLVIASMTAPLWILPAIAVLILDFFWCRKLCIWIAACCAFALPLILTVTPLNPFRGNVPTELKETSWTLLSYNVANFEDVTGAYNGDINPAIQYILKADADVVVIPEGHWLQPVKIYHIDQHQVDSVYERYPYIFIGEDITLLSKFPADTLKLSHFPHQLYRDSYLHSKAGAFVVDIHGTKTAIIGVHLKSLGLTDTDKNVYEDFTKGQGLTNKKDIQEARYDILGKIAAANVERAYQTDYLIEDIESLGYETTIVCGDFNDTPGCYALRRLSDIGLREVYPLVGSGYMYTYNSDRLLFQIDHVLFRGKFRPWSLRRDTPRTSDHYPLTVTFVVTKK